MPPSTCSNITFLFETLPGQEKLVCVFPVREYWIDIGRIPDPEKVNHEYVQQFPEAENDKG